MDFDTAWRHILQYEGERFHKIKGEPFTYAVRGQSIKPDCAEQWIPRSHFEKAFALLPLRGPGQISSLVRGASYVYAILSDKRISPDA